MSYHPPFSRKPDPIMLYCRDHTVALIAHTASDGYVCRVMEIPEGIVVEGSVKDEGRLKEVIEALLDGTKSSGALERRDTSVSFVVPESLVFTHLFTFEGKFSDALLVDAVKKRAEMIIPLPYDSLAYDFRVVAPKSSTTTSVIFTAIAKSYIAGFVSLFEQLHFVPHILESEMVSLARILMPDHVTVTAILDLGRTTTNFAIFDSDLLLPKMSQMIPVGGDAFTDAIVSHTKVEREEAERLKCVEGFDMHAGTGRTLVILQERAQVILSEMLKTINHYEMATNRKLERLILAGGGSNMPSLNLYFSMNLKCEVLVGDPMLHLRQKVSLPPNYSPIQLAPLLGLLERTEGDAANMQSINILDGWRKANAGVRQEEHQHIWSIVGIGIFVCSMLISGYIMYQMLYLPYMRYQTEAEGRTYSTVPFSFLMPEDAMVEEALADNNKIIMEITDTSTSTTPIVEEVLVTILPTPTGWLNAREGPGTTYTVLRRIYPGDTFTLHDTKGDWVEITLSGGVLGWIHKDYASIAHSGVQ